MAAGVREELSRKEVRRENTSRRAAIEGTNSSLKRSQGMDKLKVRGIVKCSMQSAFKVIGHNFKQVPGVATFYAFQDRFWPGRRPYHIRKARKKRKEKPAKGEKLPLKNPGVVKRIVTRLMAGRTFSCREENILHQILAISVVRPSLDLGLLGDPESMTIAGDGSPYESGGSPYGKKLCQCKEKCDCERRFSDPEADWVEEKPSFWLYRHQLGLNEDLKSNAT